MSTINGPKMSTILWIDQNCLISQFFIFILGCGVVLRNRVDLGFAAGEKTNTVKVSPIFIQGVTVYSGKSLSSKFGRNQCLY